MDSTAPFTASWESLDEAIWEITELSRAAPDPAEAEALLAQFDELYAIQSLFTPAARLSVRPDNGRRTPE